jgi:tetratricopeptide (TPR) repeat protein
LTKADEAENEYKKAVENYKKYFGNNEDNEKDAEAHYNLGQTYAALHQYSDAIREYKQATKIRSDDADIYYDLGMAHTKLAQYTEAANAFSKSLEIDPENYRARTLWTRLVKESSESRQAKSIRKIYLRRKRKTS